MKNLGKKVINDIKSHVNNEKNKEIIGLFKYVLVQEKTNYISDKEIKFKVSHLDLLLSLTKNDLDKIRKTYGIMGTSSMNKSELSKCISNHIEENIELIIREYFTIEEFNILKKLVLNSGSSEFENLRNEYSETNYDVIKNLKSLGLIFGAKIEVESGDKTESKFMVIIPSEFLKYLNEIVNKKNVIEVISSNNKLIKLVSGFLYYCGIANFECIWDKINSFTDLEEKDAEKYLGNYMCRFSNIKSYKNYLFNKELYNKDKILMEQAKNSDLQYKDFGMNALLMASVSTCNYENYKKIWNAYEVELFNFLQSIIDTNEENLVNIVNSCIYGSKNNFKVPEIEKYLTSVILFKDETYLHQFVKKLVALNNNASLWTLKGYSYNEIKNIQVKEKSTTSIAIKSNDDSNAATLAATSEIAATTETTLSFETKIGRNDPCICGSGKKYKKCCGKN